MSRLNRLPVLAGLLIAVIALTLTALTPPRAHAEHSGEPLQPSHISATLNVTKGEHPDNATFSATLNWTTGRHRPAGGNTGSTLVYFPPNKYQYGRTTSIDSTPSSWTNVTHTANKFNYSATISLPNASTGYFLWVRSCNSDASVCSPPLATDVVTPPPRPGILGFFQVWPYEVIWARRGFNYAITPPGASRSELNAYTYEIQLQYDGETDWQHLVTLSQTSGRYNGRVVEVTPQGRVYDFDSTRAYRLRTRAANVSGWGPWSLGSATIPAATTEQATTVLVYPDDYIRMKQLGERYDTNPRNNKIQSGELNRALSDYRAGSISVNDAVKVIKLHIRQIAINQIPVP